MTPTEFLELTEGERASWYLGYLDGYSDASVKAAEMASDEEADRHWREFRAALPLPERIKIAQEPGLYPFGGRR